MTTAAVQLKREAKLRVPVVLPGDFARDVEQGLQADPKRLPCRYFYDRDGSMLFEMVCQLPEYYLTRSEREILEARAGSIARCMPTDAAIVELGSGSSIKTRLLIDAFLRSRPSLQYVPIDISPSILNESARTLRNDFPALDVRPLAAEYGAALRQIPSIDGSKLIVILGSNLGNFDRREAAAFLRQIRTQLASGDRVLVGLDLRKPREVIEAAYNDARGLTARFNLNLLARINRELDGNFNLNCFRHRAVYREDDGFVDIQLVSTKRQDVFIGALDTTATFEADEAIQTERSFKFSAGEIDALAAAAGFQTADRWFDSRQNFALSLLAPADGPGC